MSPAAASAVRLILVKHSLPEIVPERSRREWRLSEEGRRRCGRLAERLSSYAPGKIVSSPEPKALETAQLVAAALGVALVETVDALHEHDDRDVPFQDEQSFRVAVREFFARPNQAVFGPETADAAHQRFSAAVTRLADGPKDSSIVVVAHGRVISLLVSRRNDLPAFGLWSGLGLPSFVVLELPSYAVAEVVDRV